MAWLLPLGVAAFTVCVGALSFAFVWYRGRGSGTPKQSHRLKPATHEVASAREAENLYLATTRRFVVRSDALPVHADEPELRATLVGPQSGFQSRTRAERDRRQEDATLKVGAARRGSRPSRQSSAEELLRMLGASPTPDLGNIEIYYRLGLSYLTEGRTEQARDCFLVVEGISPGYRDAAARLMHLPAQSPTASGPIPVHRAPAHSGRIEIQPRAVPAKPDLATRRRTGR